MKVCVKGKNSMPMDKYIKTNCGIAKYVELKKQKGFFRKLRFYLFVILASIRDGIFQR